MKATVYGVGINDANYQLKLYEYVNGKQKLISECPFYVKWKDMLRRCYSKSFQVKYPTYRGCTVSEDWKTFSNFKLWMESQNWDGKALDKDLLVPNNKIYSKDTCMFIDIRLNAFLAVKPGKYYLGTRLKTNRNKFESRIHDINTGKRIHLGNYDTPEEAHRKWQCAKILQIEQLKKLYEYDPIIVSCLERISKTIQYEYDSNIITTKMQ